MRAFRSPGSTRVTHDVHLGGFLWDTLTMRPIAIDRSEHNEDRTRPRIPNYVLQSIPCDPGSTVAANAGFGLARTFGASTFGLDLILEPMTSTTWADAARDTAIVGGGTIPAGGKTVENSFNFTNTSVRVGFGHEIPVTKDRSSTVGFHLGLRAYSINFRLGQTNNVERTFREQNENWIEWTPTVGFAFRTRTLHLRYNYSSTCSNRDCDSSLDVMNPDQWDRGVALAGGVIAAPSAPLTFNGGKVRMHRLSVSFPIR